MQTFDRARTWLPNVHTALSEAQPRDGLSLYRALARAMAGDPTKHDEVKQAVLIHFIRGYTGIEPLHSEKFRYYSGITLHIRGQEVSFFQALCIPDEAICSCQHLHHRTAIISAIALGLDVQIAIWDSQYNHGSGGAIRSERILESRLPAVEVNVAIVGEEKKELECMHYIISLVQDSTGSALIQFLLDRKRASALIKELYWYPAVQNKTIDWHDRRSTKYQFECFNEYRAVNSIRLSVL